MTNEAIPLRWQQIVALLLLALMFAHMLGAATRLSATIDEGFHITSGYEYTRTGQMRLLDEHVPLVKALFAWPLLLVPDLIPPEQAPGFAEGDLIAVAQGTVLAYRPIDRIIVACRIPVILLTLALAATVYRWAADQFGPTSGLLALVLLTFDPNVLAHGSLATTDVGAAAFIFWAVWAFTRYLRRPRAGRWWAAALLLGLAQGAKLTALSLLPVLGVLALGDGWLRARDSRLKTLLQRMLAFAGMILVAALVLWGLYLFEIRPLPDVQGGALPLPMASHVERWLRLRANLAYGREAFLLGQNSMHGWWYYFPLAFGLKTPLPTLVLLLAALVAFWKGARRTLLDESYLLLFPLIYGAGSLFSSLNIGYRHLLPILPFLFVFISRLTLDVSRQATRGCPHHALRFTFYVLLFWLALATLRISPHYLAYFNELAGGPDNGYRYLADSNTDWGQAYNDLARFQQEREIGPVRLSAFILYDPALYGVEYEPLTPLRGDTPAVFPSRFNPPPGDYVISATTLDGVPLADPEMYDWFRKREPDAKIGHVLFYYHVPPRDPAPDWLAQCTLPVAPLSPQAAAEGFGRDDLRLIYFDCTQAWLYPDGGRSPGWYAFYRGAETENDFARAHEALAQLTYEQRMQRDTPPFTIYEWPPVDTGDLMGDVQAGSVIAAPSGWTPAQAESEGESLAPPIALSGPLQFVGHELDVDAAAPGQALELWTYWSVTALPGSPLSLMAHLLNEAGQPVAVGDGLGVPVESWREGDLIVQRHVLEIPPEAAPGTYWLQAGAYTLPDLQRLAILSDGQLVGDRIVLARLKVGSW